MPIAKQAQASNNLTDLRVIPDGEKDFYKLSFTQGKVFK